MAITERLRRFAARPSRIVHGFAYWASTLSFYWAIFRRVTAAKYERG
jgi:hypothetical protein